MSPLGSVFFFKFVSRYLFDNTVSSRTEEGCVGLNV